MKIPFSPLSVKEALFFMVTACSYWCAGCEQVAVNNTQPYHDYDASVVPLVDSYKLLKLDGKKAEWSLNLQNQPTSVQNIDTVGVIGHTILLHSFETYARDTLRMPSWFVLDSTTHVEKQFESRKLYLQYLAAHKIKASVFSIKDFSSQVKSGGQNN